MNPAGPDFSVIVPTHNRPHQLVACLESLAALDCPRDRFEVIVVDDGSEPPVAAAVAPFHGWLQLVPLRQTQSGPGLARNRGAAVARGRFLAFTDDDCTVDPKWLGAFGAALSRHPDRLAGGRTINALAENLYSSACHTIIDAAYEHFDPAAGRAHFFPSNNFAMSAAQFHAVGGFTNRWTLAAAEDREFCRRWMEHGFALMRVPDAVIQHHHALSFSRYCELHYRYGRGAFFYHNLPSAAAGPGGLQPAWPFYRACFRHAFRHPTWARRAGILSLLGVWQVANAAGYFRERLRAQVSADAPRPSCTPSQ